MKFKGDIIITDPCYIIKESNIIHPNYLDYMSKETYTKKPIEFSEEEKKQVKKWSIVIYKYFKDREKNDDWKKCNYGENMEVLGIQTYLSADTEYGDWSCTTYEENTHKELGTFCADAGMVSVFLLKEVLAYNPKFNYHLEKNWTTTLIKDYDGDIKITHRNEEVSVVGKGNINFFTTQTGF